MNLLDAIMAVRVALTKTADPRKSLLRDVVLKRLVVVRSVIGNIHFVYGRRRRNGNAGAGRCPRNPEIHHVDLLREFLSRLEGDSLLARREGVRSLLEHQAVRSFSPNFAGLGTGVSRQYLDGQLDLHLFIQGVTNRKLSRGRPFRLRKPNAS